MPWGLGETVRSYNESRGTDYVANLLSFPLDPSLPTEIERERHGEGTVYHDQSRPCKYCNHMLI